MVGEPEVTEYMVKWKGFGMDECTWERSENLEGAARAVAAYERSTVQPQAQPAQHPDPPAEPAPPPVAGVSPKVSPNVSDKPPCKPRQV